MIHDSTQPLLLRLSFSLFRSTTFTSNPGLAEGVGTTTQSRTFSCCPEWGERRGLGEGVTGCPVRRLLHLGSDL